MDLQIVDQKSLNPRRSRTLPAWLSVAASSSTVENQQTIDELCSINSQNPAVKIEVCSDDEVSSPQPSSSTDVDPPNQPAVDETRSLDAVFVKAEADEETQFICEEDVHGVAKVELADSTCVTTDVTVKLEPDSASESQPCDQTLRESVVVWPNVIQPTSSSVPVLVESSPSVPQTTADTTVRASRPTCIYRHKCYRANTQHKNDFSHPGDSDYDGQPVCDSTSCNSAAARPRCWYGSNCYRKSDEHKRKFYHSPPSTTRKRNATQRALVNSNNGDNSDEYEDSFIDDNSSVNLSWTSSDEEFSDFEDDSASDCDEFDGSMGPGKPKKKKFSIL